MPSQLAAPTAASSSSAPRPSAEEELCSASLQSVSEVPSPIRETSPPRSSKRGLLPSWLLRLRGWVWTQLEELFEVCARVLRCIPCMDASLHP